MNMFDFDCIGEWGPSLSSHLSGLVPSNVGATILKGRPEFPEDAADILFSDICRDKGALIASVSGWIKSQTIGAYHGSRLTDAEIEDIRARGLLALVPNERKDFLSRKLGRHPRWAEAATRLDSVIDELGERHTAGNRNGQTHATLSCAGLVRHFNHYLTHGSEFDQHAARDLLGAEGTALLASYGKPTLITLAVPGDSALKAANPFPTLVGDMPNFVRPVINVWAYWLAYPDYSFARQIFDYGLTFFQDVPAQWIFSIEHVDIDVESWTHM
jgi:hypothetical protein